MSFQILPNLIFLFAVLGIIILILRRIPEATGSTPLPGINHDPEQLKEAGSELRDKGVPVAALSKTRQVIVAAGKKVWRFILEAKGLSQAPRVNYKINKILGRSESEEKTNVVLDENYYIDQIKRFPKDWQHYNNLGQYYLDSRSYEDALGVYEYLTKQDAANDDFWARLGFAKFGKNDYKGAVESYGKAIELDQSHPNRYYNLGLAYLELKQIDKAVAALEKAIQLEPENSKYTEALTEAKNLIKN